MSESFLNVYGLTHKMIQSSFKIKMNLEYYT